MGVLPPVGGREGGPPMRCSVRWKQDVKLILHLVKLKNLKEIIK